MTTSYGLGINQSMNLAYNLGELSGLDGGGVVALDALYLVTDAGEYIVTDAGENIIIG